ncbi:MAG: hypothetical protein AAGH89_00125 [Verrucomicrobiota bacterium]
MFVVWCGTTPIVEGAESGTEIAARLLRSDFQKQLLLSDRTSSDSNADAPLRARPLLLQQTKNRPTTPDLQQLQDLLDQFGRHADLLVRDLRNQLKSRPDLRPLMADVIANQVRGSVLSTLCAYSANLDAMRPDCRVLDHAWRATASKLQQREAPDSLLGSARAIDRELSKVRTLLKMELSIDHSGLAQHLEITAFGIQELRAVLNQSLAHEVSASDWDYRMALLEASLRAAAAYSTSSGLNQLTETVDPLWKDFSTIRSEWSSKSTFQLDCSAERVRENFIAALRLRDREPLIDQEQLLTSVDKFQTNLTPIRGNLAVSKLLTIPEQDRDQLLTEIDQLIESCAELRTMVGADKPARPTDLRAAVGQLSQSWMIIARQLAPLRARVYVDSRVQLEFYEDQIRALVGLSNFSESIFLSEIAVEIQAHASVLNLNGLAGAAQQLAELASESEKLDASKVRLQVENLIRNSQPILADPSNAREITLRKKIAILSAGWNP